MARIIPNQFTVIRSLREDRASATFLAEDNVLERSNVVVKVVRKGHFTSDHTRLGELFSWFMGVRHSQLAPILHAGLTRKRNLYYVRDYLSSTLFSGHHNEAMPALVSTVSFLHSQGRVHGAIKPANIFFSSGLIKLADPRIDGTEPLTDTEEKIRFSAPEVLKGAKPTLESDLYSLGAILYRLLTGQDAFDDPDLAHLKSKYIWARPRPVSDLAHISKSISDAIAQLLDKDPRKRSPAFRALRDCLDIEPQAAYRAPFVGRETHFRQVENAQSKASKEGLQVILIEGEPGIGKSRFIEELRIRCGFQAGTFVVARCPSFESPESRDFQPILEGLRAVANSNESDLRTQLGNFWPTLCKYFFPDDTPLSQNYPLEKIVSDFVGLTSVFARRRPTTLVIEDIHHSDRATEQFIEMLAMRAAEVPLTLILTRRALYRAGRLCETLNQCLADNFQRIRLMPLTGAMAQMVARHLESSPELQDSVLEISAGNPLFIETYVSSDPKSLRTVPTRLCEPLTWILTNIGKPVRRVAEILSLLNRPSTVDSVAELTQTGISNVQQNLNELEWMGLVEITRTEAAIKYPVVRARLYLTIDRRRRRDLHRGAYATLKSQDCDTETLAHHSFQGEMFEEAAVLYLRLATDNYEQQNYNAAMNFYQKVEQCGKVVQFGLTPLDKVRLATCYKLTGKQGLAQKLFNSLLSLETVQRDPELRSSIYQSLANLLPKKALGERIRLYRAGIDSLPSDSPQRTRRYCDLCIAFVQIGDFSAAGEALRQAEQESSPDPKTLAGLRFARSILLMISADFRVAADHLRSEDLSEMDQGAVLSNLAHCTENLGNLRRARDLQLRAQKVASNSGAVPLEIVSLVNLGSMETKLGNIRKAEQLFEKAIDWIDRLRRRNWQFDVDRFAVAYADATLHFVKTGKYRRATECLKKIGPAESVFELDRMFIALTRCEFYLAIGPHSKILSLLKLLRSSPTFKSGFFEVEHTLIEARFESSATHEEIVSNLKRALDTAQKLGTLYQQCKVLKELARVLTSAEEKSRAEDYAKKALRIAKTNGYKVLCAQALLLIGITAKSPRRKQLCLLGSLQNATEMGLPELVSESAFHIGRFQLEAGNCVTAREHLTRSVAITTELSEEISSALRSAYTARAWRPDARKLLEQCNRLLESESYGLAKNGSEDRFFRTVYRLTIAAMGSHNLEDFVTSLVSAIETALTRPAVITLKSNNEVITKAIRIRPSDELVQRIMSISTKAHNRIYFGCPDKTQSKDTVAWIPLLSQNCEGGLYVTSGSGDSTLNEREIEFLTILGMIGNGALQRMENRKIENSRLVQVTEFHGIIGSSKAIRQVYSHIEIAAGNAATVLIEGESGTGKELVAKAIHAASPRAKEAFVPVDCGAIPETLIEAELFGAKKGSYTGATTDRPGLFEAAHRGTIFLDEISNTSPAVQGKLLRVLQEREVRRIGETNGRPVDVRLIVASNANLDALVQEGSFRKDLLYRLKVLHIKLPPLRSRREDVPMLAHAFLDRLNLANKTRKHFAAGVINQLMTHSFPGNVRELQNAIERAFFSAKGTMIEEVPLEHRTEEASTNEVQTWFKDLADGRKDFWSAVHNRYKRRDISREKVIALVDFGLRSTRGSYKMMASMFHLKENEYRRFMDFLRRNDCLLDFRPYRKAADNAS